MRESELYYNCSKTIQSSIKIINQKKNYYKQFIIKVFTQNIKNEHHLDLIYQNNDT